MRLIFIHSPLWFSSFETEEQFGSESFLFLLCGNWGFVCAVAGKCFAMMMSVLVMIIVSQKWVKNVSEINIEVLGSTTDNWFVPCPTAHPVVSEQSSDTFQQPKGVKIWWCNINPDGPYLTSSRHLLQGQGYYLSCILFSSSSLLFHLCITLLMLSASPFICSFLLSFVLSTTSNGQSICKTRYL